eukprot:Ihof_evm9s36 gene=Ihof_evmTU9s36
MLVTGIDDVVLALLLCWVILLARGAIVAIDSMVAKWQPVAMNYYNTTSAATDRRQPTSRTTSSINRRFGANVNSSLSASQSQSNTSTPLSSNPLSNGLNSQRNTSWGSLDNNHRPCSPLTSTSNQMSAVSNPVTAALGPINQSSSTDGVQVAQSNLPTSSDDISPTKTQPNSALLATRYPSNEEDKLLLPDGATRSSHHPDLTSTPNHTPPLPININDTRSRTREGPITNDNRGVGAETRGVAANRMSDIPLRRVDPFTAIWLCPNWQGLLFAIGWTSLSGWLLLNGVVTLIIGSNERARLSDLIGPLLFVGIGVIIAHSFLLQTYTNYLIVVYGRCVQGRVIRVESDPTLIVNGIPVTRITYTYQPSVTAQLQESYHRTFN